MHFLPDAGIEPSGRMRRNSFATCVALACLSVLLLLTGCPNAETPRARSAPADRISIALSSTPHAGLLHLAAAQNYFAEEGLEVSITPVTHGKAALELLNQGKVDLAAAAEVPFVIAVLQGNDLSIAATVGSVSSEMAVVARRDRGIAAPRDLAGKRIGVTFGTSGEYYLWALLIRNKVAPEDVALVDLPPGRLTQALAAGEIDAVSTWEPIQTQAAAALGPNGALFSDGDIYTVTHVLVGRNGFLRAHSAAVQKLLRAALRAEQFNRQSPQQAIALASSQLKMDTRVLEPAWKGLDFRVDLQQSQLLTLESQSQWARARGYAGAGAAPNFLSHLHADALLAVHPNRVTLAR